MIEDNASSSEAPVNPLRFEPGDRMCVKPHIGRGRYGGYYGGDVGTVVGPYSSDRSGSVIVDFDARGQYGRRSGYAVLKSELEPLNVEGQEPGLFEEVRHV